MVTAQCLHEGLRLEATTTQCHGISALLHASCAARAPFAERHADLRQLREALHDIWGASQCGLQNIRVEVWDVRNVAQTQVAQILHLN